MTDAQTPTQEPQASLRFYSYGMPSLISRAIDHLRLADEYLNQAVHGCELHGDDGTYIDPLKDLREQLERQVEQLNEVGG